MESSSVGDASELDISMLGDVKESQDPFLNLSRKLTERLLNTTVFSSTLSSILQLESLLHINFVLND